MDMLDIVGVFGNLLVIVTVLTQKALRSAYNLYIVNLAVADLVVCGYTSPFWMLDFHFGYHPVVNRTHCSCNAVILVRVHLSGLETEQNQDRAMGSESRKPAASTGDNSADNLRF
nr:hypothetical protein BaRGS_024355 [Batillaria attramentaria]